MTHNEHQRRLVLRVNELFHDLEGREYDAIHPEIFEREKERWVRLLKEVMPMLPSPKTTLDLGAGTGFVGSLLRRHLKHGDTMICADISQEMLKCCEKTFGNATEGFALRTFKLHDEHLDLPDASVDLVTLNSVLHHIPDSTRLLGEIVRVLKPGSIVMIGHEPNTLFFRSRLLVALSRILHHATPKRIAALLLKSFGLYDRLVTEKHAVDGQLDRLNKTLIQEGLIAVPLARPEVSALIDVHSPTAGGLRRDEGFDPVHLFDRWPVMHPKNLDTYAYVPKGSGGIIGAYDALLHVLAPTRGGTFFLIARKAPAPHA